MFRRNQSRGCAGKSIRKSRRRNIRTELDLLAIQRGEQIYRHDLILLGMGDDGHTASLFPGTSAVEEKTRKVVANFVPKFNSWRMTFTFPLINQARHICFLVNANKNAGACRASARRAISNIPRRRWSRPIRQRSPGFSGRRHDLRHTRSSFQMPMRKIIVTGSAGLIGSETVKHFAQEGYRVVGIDNDMRSRFFGAEASTQKTRDLLMKTVRGYEHHDLDIRDAKGVLELFKEHRQRDRGRRAHRGATFA